MEKYVEEFVMSKKDEVELDVNLNYVMSRFERHSYSFEQVFDIIKKVWIYILFGVGIVAIIHGYIPASIINNILGSNNPFSVIIATLIGVTMYADIFGTLLIAEALVLKGVGTLPSVGKLKKIFLTC